MARPSRKMLIGDLISSKVVTADGKKVGRVVDVEVSAGPEYRVIGLDYGLHAWLYRVHVLRPLTRLLSGHEEPCTIPWDAVDRFENWTIWLKP